MKIYQSLIILFIIVLSACNSSTNTAVIPTDKMDESWWENRHEQVLSQIKEKDPWLILIGNSITHALDDNSNVEFWDNYLNQYNTVNMGFSGDRTENVIWRLKNGEIDGINPKVATIMIGTNNLDGNHYEEISDPKDLAKGIWKICSILNEQLPETEIALLAIFPFGFKPTIYKNKLINETNEIIKSFPEKNSKIHFFDVREVLLDDDGKVRRELMPDYLHPNTEGYRLIFDALAPEIEKLLESE